MTFPPRQIGYFPNATLTSVNTSSVGWGLQSPITKWSRKSCSMAPGKFRARFSLMPNSALVFFEAQPVIAFHKSIKRRCGIAARKNIVGGTGFTQQRRKLCLRLTALGSKQFDILVEENHSGVVSGVASLKSSAERIAAPIPDANNGGTALPVWVYCGNSDALLFLAATPTGAGPQEGERVIKALDFAPIRGL